jgi:hypothetical protein
MGKKRLAKALKLRPGNFKGALLRGIATRESSEEGTGMPGIRLFVQGRIGVSSAKSLDKRMAPAPSSSMDSSFLHLMSGATREKALGTMGSGHAALLQSVAHFQ